MPDLRLSHSQQQSLHGCTLSWWLQRRALLPGLTYWSTLAGSVAHERIEVKIRTGHWPDESIQEHLDRLVAEELHGSPYTIEDIRTSKALPPGLKAAAWPNGFRYDSVLAAIPMWLKTWELWYAAKQSEGWRPWIYPDDGTSSLLIGMPGAEVHIEQVLGDHPTVGSIDLVLENEYTGEIAIWDYKFGRSKPDNTMQLDAYRLGFAKTYGLEATYAGFYFGRTGKEKVAEWPTFGEGYLHDVYRAAGVKADRAERGDFDIDLTRCQYLCPVRDYCPIMQGDMMELALPLPGEERDLLGGPIA
jgi:hypothetical protein